MGFAVMNVVSVTPEQAAVLAGEVEGTSLASLRGQPGLLAARLYRGEDENEVVTITEWESREAFLAYRRSEAGRRAVASAVAAHPKISFFEIVATLGPA